MVVIEMEYEITDKVIILVGYESLCNLRRAQQSDT